MNSLGLWILQGTHQGPSALISLPVRDVAPAGCLMPHRHCLGFDGGFLAGLLALSWSTVHADMRVVS